MNNLDSHDFELIKITSYPNKIDSVIKNIPYCKNCHWDGEYCKLFNCNELISKSNSHTWKEINTYTFTCVICDIIGIKSPKDFISLEIYKIYSCNEWLMLRANE